MDIGNYERIDREPRRRTQPADLRPLPSETKQAPASGDKVAILFILQTLFALILTSALILAVNGYLGHTEGVLPHERTDDIAVQTLSELYETYFSDFSLAEDTFSSLFPSHSGEESTVSGEEESHVPVEEEEKPEQESSAPSFDGEETADDDTISLRAESDSPAYTALFSPTTSAFGLSGSLAIPGSVTLAPILTTAQAVSPLSNWDMNTVSSPFGYRYHPISGNVDFHGGIDIPAPSGTPIRAVFPGTVVETGYSDIFGNYILLEHTTGTQTRYCHCSRLAVSEGIRVRAGETIAYVGSTGVSTGSHLHLDLLINGLYADPCWLFRSPFSR
ncbi:MAG: M23 family metallopeptidase [Ruminococcaceae bacterium]|nr:M23 family metallopeptidase [Oscillospiraceae bacterium]